MFQFLTKITKTYFMRKHLLTKTGLLSALFALAIGSASAVNFAGTYTLTGTKYIYEEGVYSSSESNATLELVINDENYIAQIGSYDLEQLIASGYGIEGTVDDNTFSISTSDAPLYLTLTDPNYVTLGGFSNYGQSFDDDETIDLTYNNGTWELKSLSFWNFDYNTSEYQIIEFWMIDTVEKTSDDTGNEDPTPEVTNYFPGTYSITGTVYDYTNGTTPTEDTQTIDVVIDEEGVVLNWGDYDLSELVGTYYEIKGVIDGNTYTISTDETLFLTVGATADILGGKDAYNYEGSSIVLSYDNDGNWSITDFSIWVNDWSNSTQTLKYYWQGNTVEKTDGIEPGAGGDTEEPEPSEPESNYAATYSVVGTRTLYTNSRADGAPEESAFLIELVENENGGYSFAQFANYSVEDNVGFSITATQKGSILTSSTSANSYLEGTPTSQIKFSSSEEFIDNFSLVIEFTSETEAAISDFGIYNYTIEYFEEDGQQWAMPVYTLLEEWSDMTVTKGTDAYDEAVGGGNDGDDSGIETVSSSSNNISVYGNTIYIEGSFSTANVVDTTGRVIAATSANSVTVNPGIYIVVVDGKATKVLVK